MRAKIIQYDATAGSGIANTEDGQQYDISIRQWRSASAPAVGQTIDITLENGTVSTIFISSSGGSSGDNDRLIAILTHIGGIAFGFIPALIIYFAMKDSPFVRDTAREAFNWQITAFIAVVISSILIFVIIGIFLIWAVVIANLVFCIIGAVKASKQEVYRYPIAIRILK
jgi:uncharacterized Tic20 family protein